MSKTTIAFSVDTEHDKDILTWLARQDNKSDAIRKAIRATLGALTLGDVYQEIVEIKWLLRNGAAVAHDDPEPDDPAVAEVKGLLAGLGL